MARPTRFALLFASLIVAIPCGAQDFEDTNPSLPYPGPPYRYEGNQVLSITFKTNPEVLRALVPAPLEPNPDGLMALGVGRLKVVDPRVGEYNEAFLVIPVKHEGEAGLYMPVLYLDSDVSILGGREVYGFNKVGADVTWGLDGDRFHARVVRRGTTIIEVSATLGERVGAPGQAPDQTFFNVKRVPSPEKGKEPLVKQLVAVRVHDVKVGEGREAKATLRLASTPLDPLDRIPVREVLQAKYQEQGYVLGFGEVVHDYLAKDAEGGK
jgi:acetoacetate decarboxylase